MSDRRPDCVYGILVREGRVFLRLFDGGYGLPGGVFRPLAEDRKVELRAHLFDQLGIGARNVWAQGAFDYRNPDETCERFCGFFSVWDWDGDVPSRAGDWFDASGVPAAPALHTSLRILLLRILATLALKTT